MGINQSRAERELINQVVAGDIEWAARLLQKGASANTIGWNEDPILVMAVRKQNRDMVRLLLARGADAWKIGRFGNAVELAIRRPDSTITEMLIRSGGLPTSDTPLLRMGDGFGWRVVTAIEKQQYLMSKALLEGFPEHVETLERSGFPEFDAANYGRRPLYDAMHQGDWKTIAFLVRRGMPSCTAVWRIPEARRVLVGAGLDPTEPPPDWSYFHQPQPMTPSHPLWGYEIAIQGLEADDGPLARPAAHEELASIASLGAHPLVLEFYAHFLPSSRRGPFGVFHDFNWLMFENMDIRPEFSRFGYLIFGKDISGDFFAFSPTANEGHCTPEIVRFSHERGYDEIDRGKLATLAEPIAADIAEFLRSLSNH
jgi:ankyrin repeat protein